MKTLIMTILTLTFSISLQADQGSISLQADQGSISLPEREIQKVDEPTAMETPAAVIPVVKVPAKPLPYTFEAWKKRKSVDAQNKLSRLINKILELKSGSFEDSVEALGNKSERSALAQERKDEISALESEKAMAQEELEDAKSFTFDQYLSVYVRTLSAENLQLWVKHAKPEDTQKILNLYLNSRIELSGSAVALGQQELGSTSAEKTIKN